MLLIFPGLCGITNNVFNLLYFIPFCYFWNSLPSLLFLVLNHSSFIWNTFAWIPRYLTQGKNLEEYDIKADLNSDTESFAQGISVKSDYYTNPLVFVLSHVHVYTHIFMINMALVWYSAAIYSAWKMRWICWTPSSLTVAASQLSNSTCHHLGHWLFGQDAQLLPYSGFVVVGPIICTAGHVCGAIVKNHLFSVAHWSQQW